MGRRSRVLPLVRLRDAVILVIAATVGIIVLIVAAYTFSVWNAAGALTAGRSTPTPAPQLEVPKEPWRERWGHLPTARPSIIHLVTDPEELRKASFHHDRIEMISGQYLDEGPKEPITVNVDKFGRARLSNGHHRLIIAERQHLALPVKIDLVDRIGGWSAPVGPFLVAIAAPR